MINFIKKSVLAGLLISLAGWIKLSCSDPIVGSILFSVGLISVFMTESKLFTGAVGNVNSKRSIFELFPMLGLNLVISILIGLCYQEVCGTSDVFTEKMKLDQLQILPTLFKGVGCGALIYLAVMFWKTEKQIHQIIPVILCVAGFILGGFEHSIACAFYLGSSVTTVTEFFTGLLYILIVAAGNAIGSLTIRGLWKGLIK